MKYLNASLLGAGLIKDLATNQIITVIEGKSLSPYLYPALRARKSAGDQAPSSDRH